MSLGEQALEVRANAAFRRFTNCLARLHVVKLAVPRDWVLIPKPCGGSHAKQRDKRDRQYEAAPGTRLRVHVPGL